MEHEAQVILYTIIMSERYLKHIDCGLLYYLHTDQTQEIKAERSKLVGLIMRRNELANDILKALRMQQLPPMLQRANVCRSCRHLSVCSIYHKAYGGTLEDSGLDDAFESHIRHLTASHCDFLRQWDRLIDLEAKEMLIVKKGMRHSRQLKSEQPTSFISSIVLDPSSELPLERSSKDNRFTYHFVCQNLPCLDVGAHDGDSLNSASSPNTFDCTLRSGDHVVLSTDNGVTVANGVIMDISSSHVSVRTKVSLSKMLRLPGRSHSTLKDLYCEVWHIEKDEMVTSFAIMRFNLVQLFLPSIQSSHIRKMIVDLEAPRFDGGCIFSQDPAISYVRSEKNLNNDQRRAILKMTGLLTVTAYDKFQMLTAKDYALILGMPGTGKTSTMVHAVKALLIKGASILLTSYTNSAVDNLLIKLKAQGIDFVRIGRYDAVHEEIQGNCLSDMDIRNVEDIKRRLDQVKVYAVTCLGVTSPLLSNRRFDICIMDEAGQITIPVSLGPLMFASKFVLVGDHYQLPPLVQSIEARENGMGISLFCRLSEAHPQAIAALQSQYRMCAGIMELSNSLIYGNRLHCGSSEIENAKLKFNTLKFSSLWLKEVLDPNRPVVFINTGFSPLSSFLSKFLDKLLDFEEKDHITVDNPLEADIIMKVTEGLIDNGIKEEDIGIITPYNSQAKLIRQATAASVEIHTIDKYQGRDKDCILLSFVRSSKNSTCASSLLGDWHRINVALTRAKKKLIMVGSCSTLSKVPLLKLLIEKVDDLAGIIILSEHDMNHKVGLRKCSKMRMVEDWGILGRTIQMTCLIATLAEFRDMFSNYGRTRHLHK
ncbi:DNA2/NAM7 helicase, helicase domain, partial [Dillenia turbinata]